VTVMVAPELMPVIVTLFEMIHPCSAPLRLVGEG